MRAGRGVAELVRVEALARLEALVVQLGRCASGRGGSCARRRACGPTCARTSTAARARASTARRRAASTSPRPPSGTRSRRGAARGSPSAERRDEAPPRRRRAARASARARTGRRSPRASAHALERRVRVGGDHRADELEREPDRARLERRQPRRRAERVAEELLVDVHVVAVQLGVDRVAAAAEVDEVEQREVLLRAGPRGMWKRSTSSRAGMTAWRLVAAAREQVREQRLEHGRSAPARRARPGDRPRRRVRGASSSRQARAARPRARSRTLRSAEPTTRRSSSGSSGRARPSWRSTHDASSGRRRVLVTKTSSSKRPWSPNVALDPPGGVGRHLDPRLAGRRRRSASSAGRGSRRSSNSAGMRKSRSRRVAKRMSPRMRETRNVRMSLRVEVLADDVPGAVAVAEQPVRVDRALALVVARDRPVVELDRALLRDRALELAEPAGHLGRVVGVVDLDLDAQRRRRRRRREAGAAEREVLQREPQRLRVRELALEQVEAGLERRELVVGELERREEVAAPSGACRAPRR